MSEARVGGRELFLLDGSSLAYRAFFALPESIATSTGEPTNAIYGLAAMLVKILSEYGEVPTIVAWDAGYSGRKDVYPEYKAQRASRPDLLKAQWPQFAPLVEAFGYRNVRVEGYEADDVIASIARLAREQADAESGEPIKVTIVTGDRDAFQLIDERTSVLATARGITDTKLYDTQAVIDRWGIKPELVPDFIGLKGDSSDNIPGVPGIGEKTASELLVRFGSLEAVLDSIDEISGAKRKQNLTEHADDARVSKQLAMADRAVPLELNLRELVDAEPDRSRLREFFRRFELRELARRTEQLLGELPASGGVSGADSGGASDQDSGAATDGECGMTEMPTVNEVDVAQLASVLGSLAEGAELSLATVAPDLPEGALFGAEGSWKFAIWSATDEQLLAGECANPADVIEAIGPRPVITHAAKTLGEVPAGLAHDTELAAYLLEPARRAYPLGELLEDRGIAVPNGDAGPAPLALALTRLAAAQRSELKERGLQTLMEEIELPLVAILRSMEQTGCKLDVAALNEISARVKAEAQTVEAEIFELAGEQFTLGSPKQLEAILFDKLGLTRGRRGKTGYSTDARVLQAIRKEHPIVALIERWRELTKLAATYLDALPALIAQDGRIHTTFNQTAVATGRLSSTNPNLQNIPIRTPLGREIRACFVAEPERLLVSADYSQVELRLLAQIAGEQALLEIFRHGEDVHTATACRVFGVAPEQVDSGMRSKAKMVNYGIVYGLSAFGLADRLDIPQSEAAEFIKLYMAGFPAIEGFIADVVAQGTEQGYVTTAFGRRRQLPELAARRHEVRKQGERFAVNMVIQGTAADIMKIAMVRAAEALSREGLQTRMILQIHDELLFEGPEAEAEQVRALAVREMVGAYPMDPPLEVDAGVGVNWLSAK